MSEHYITAMTGDNKWGVVACRCGEFIHGTAVGDDYRRHLAANEDTYPPNCDGPTIEGQLAVEQRLAELIAKLRASDHQWGIDFRDCGNCRSKDFHDGYESGVMARMEAEAATLLATVTTWYVEAPSSTLVVSTPNG